MNTKPGCIQWTIFLLILFLTLLQSLVFIGSDIVSQWDSVVTRKITVETTTSSSATEQQRLEQRNITPKHQYSLLSLQSMSKATMRNPVAANTPSSSQSGPLIGKQFSFVVAGFPKTGTTTLLKTLGDHREVSMPSREECAVSQRGMATETVQIRLTETLQGLSSSPHKAFKCPTAVYHSFAFQRLEQHSPSIKLVLGLRHPVELLQSFYNYRVTEVYNRGWNKSSIPSLHDIVGKSGQPWKGVSMEAARYDIYLKQLGKTGVTAAELRAVEDLPTSWEVRGTPFPVFIYTMEQLDDTNATSSLSFRNTLSQFLGLRTPLGAFGKENVNQRKSAFTESIQICDDEWASVRAKLVEYGGGTADWIVNKFIESADVVVANREQFVATLAEWNKDPCDLTASS